MQKNVKKSWREVFTQTLSDDDFIGAVDGLCYFGVERLCVFEVQQTRQTEMWLRFANGNFFIQFVANRLSFIANKLDDRSHWRKLQLRSWTPASEATLNLITSNYLCVIVDIAGDVFDFIKLIKKLTAVINKTHASRFYRKFHRTSFDGEFKAAQLAFTLKLFKATHRHLNSALGHSGTFYDWASDPNALSVGSCHSAKGKLWTTYDT